MAIKWSSAWSFVDKYYPPTGKEGDKYRDNWDRIFGKKEDEQSETQWPTPSQETQESFWQGIVDQKDCYEKLSNLILGEKQVLPPEAFGLPMWHELSVDNASWKVVKVDHETKTVTLEPDDR